MARDGMYDGFNEVLRRFILNCHRIIACLLLVLLNCHSFLLPLLGICLCDVVLKMDSTVSVLTFWPVANVLEGHEFAAKQAKLICISMFLFLTMKYVLSSSLMMSSAELES